MAEPTSVEYISSLMKELSLKDQDLQSLALVFRPDGQKSSTHTRWKQCWGCWTDICSSNQWVLKGISAPTDFEYTSLPIRTELICISVSNVPQQNSFGYIKTPPSCPYKNVLLNFFLSFFSLPQYVKFSKWLCIKMYASVSLSWWWWTFFTHQTHHLISIPCFSKASESQKNPLQIMTSSKQGFKCL